MTTAEVEILAAVLEARTAKFDAAMKRAEQLAASTTAAIAKTAARVQVMGDSLTSFGRNVVASLGGVSVALGAVGTIKWAVGLAASAESSQLAFETMLGSAQRATDMLVGLQRFADTTPLEMPGVTRAAQTLMQFGIEGEMVLPLLQRIGDVALGNSDRFQHLALAFGQMAAAGRLMGQDLLQMVSSGFNPLLEISRTTGRSMNDLREDMRDGAISVEMVARAFQTASAPGGRFFGALERESRSLAGRFSTLKDTINGFLRTVGQELVQGLSLKEMIKSLTEVASIAADFAKNLPPGLKQAALAFGLATAGSMALAAGLYLLRASGGFLFTPLTAGVMALSAGFALLVAHTGGIKEAWEAVKGAVLPVFDRIRDGLGVATSAVRDFVSRNADVFAGIFAGTWLAVAAISSLAVKFFELGTAAVGWIGRSRETVVAIGAIVGTVAVAAVTFKVLSTAASLTMAVLSSIGVVQAAQAAIWVAWTAAVVVAKAAILAWAGIVLVAKAATWLLNVALTATNVLLAPAIIIGAAAAFVTLGVGIMAVKAAAGAAVVAGGALLTTLQGISTTTGPIAAIGGMLREWQGILGNVFAGFGKNSTMAMDLLKAGFSLAIAQIQAMWPPLWQFLKDGFAAISKLVADAFAIDFNRRMVQSLRPLFELAKLFNPALAATGGPFSQAMANIDQTAAGSLADATAEMEASLGRARDRFNEALAGGDSPAVAARRAEVRRLEAALAALPATPPTPPMPGGANMEDVLARWRSGLDAVGDAAKKTVHEVKRLDAALVGSSEANARIEKYLDMLAEMRATAPRPPAPLPANAVDAARQVGLGALGPLAGLGAAAPIATPALPPMDAQRAIAGAVTAVMPQGPLVGGLMTALQGFLPQLMPTGIQRILDALPGITPQPVGAAAGPQPVAAQPVAVQATAQTGGKGGRGESGLEVLLQAVVLKLTSIDVSTRTIAAKEQIVVEDADLDE